MSQILNSLDFLNNDDRWTSTTQRLKIEFEDLFIKQNLLMANERRKTLIMFNQT